MPGEIIHMKVDDIAGFIDAIRLRVDVFIIEQGFKPGFEPDEDDRNAVHFITKIDGKTVATARVRETADKEYKIERMAVEKNSRKNKIGKKLLEYIVNWAKKSMPKRVWLKSQFAAKEFYEKSGFVQVSEPYEMHGVMHVDMELK